MNRRTLLALVVLSCSASPLLAHDRPDAGAVYALTNAPTGNAVVIYARAADGSLTPAGQAATGGTGTGTGLGSQGAVIVSDDRRFVFAVNAGSQTVSSFRVTRHGLTLVDVAPSGGVMPTSLAFSRGLLYVLNVGSPNNISGLRVDARGGLRPLPGSTRPLSAAQTSPAQVGFSRRGDVLVVSERATNQLLAYAIDHRGYASAPVVFPSAGPTPFGFAIGRRDTLLVSEAGAGGGASTYRITDAPSIDPVSSNVMTGQRAACWAVITGSGRFGYVTNAGTGNVSGFALDGDGAATLLNADGVTATTGANPTDAALSGNSRFLYVRVGNLNAIAVFRVNGDGSLIALPSRTGTPAGMVGLAAF